jgi:NADPH-dependent curcumin reductase CurA
MENRPYAMARRPVLRQDAGLEKSRTGNDMTISREVHLIRRPVGVPVPADFDLVTVELPAPAAGQVQVRNLFMSVDPYMRGRISGIKSYAEPWGLNEVMKGSAVGEVIASNDPSLQVGDKVQGDFAFREFYNAPASALVKLPAVNVPPSAFLGVAGMPGLTAYVGLLRIAALKPGDTVFVSGAAGAVGATVAQIAKIKGHTVIGTAGGPEKVAFLKSIGVDHAIDYKAVPDLAKAVIEAAPQGIDVYFDNVGGEHFEAAIAAANRFARFAVCGMISQYNNTDAGYHVKNLSQIVGKSLRIQGFIVSDNWDMHPAFLQDMGQWLPTGQVKFQETVDNGIESAVSAFLKLFKGENLGKMVVKLG